MTTGGKPRLLGITKRGNGYLRRMLIHGARAALPSLAWGKTLMGEWLRGLLSRAHMNTAVVALAAKMARIIWAVLKSGRPFDLKATSSTASSNSVGSAPFWLALSVSGLERWPDS
jgi:hypothetical protein